MVVSVKKNTIKKRIFGVLPDGRTITVYTLRNRWGEYVELLDFGAAIHSIFVRDARGNLSNVVLQVNSTKELTGRSYEGVTIGRCANRIAFGRYMAEGRMIQLETNSGQHFLHGASGNYAFKLFHGQIDEAENKVTFTLLDSGEGGFDCNVQVSVSFSFGDDKRLTIEYKMIPEGTTVLCPTNHAYFNLSGGDIREHDLQIYAETIACKGENGIPEGKNLKIKSTPWDFRNRQNIRDAIESDMTGYFDKESKVYDDTFILSKQGFGLAAELSSKAAGRKMLVYTDMPALIVFTPPPKQEKDNKKYIAICLETQYVPNSVNCPQYQSCVFRKGEKLSSRTVYEFIMGVEE